MKFEADEKKLAEEIGELIHFYINHSGKPFSASFHELYWKIYVPAKNATKKQG